MTEIKYIVKSIAIITVLYFVFWLPQFVNILSNNKEAVEFRKNGGSINTQKLIKLDSDKEKAFYSSIFLAVIIS